VVRRFGTALVGLTRFIPGERRPYPPGQHGPKHFRIRLSDYGLRLLEKQKLLYYYGLRENQLDRLVHRAIGKTGPTGEILLAFLERRLDNVVFRLGFAPTIPAARQIVRHGHIIVNGRRVSMPAYEVHVGDRIEASLKGRQHPLIAEGAQRGPELTVPTFLERDKDGFGGRVTGEPARADTPIDIDEKLVVEYYAA